MRTPHLLIWIIAIIVALLVPVARAATPGYTLEQSEGVGVLSVTGAEIVIVDGEGASIVQGLAIPAVGNRVGLGAEQVWSLAPGVYAVTAYAPAAAPGLVRESVVWELTVDDAAEPTRLQRIADALARWIAVANDWAALAPDPEEVRDALLVTFREPRPPVAPVPPVPAEPVPAAKQAE